MTLYWLGNDSNTDFPPLDAALSEPDGLLAAGGDLSEQRLLAAYSRGIFPWYSDGQPILWWSPDPRMILCPSAFHCSRSLKRHLQRTEFEITVNRDFEQVIQSCAAPREDDNGTWITDAMEQAYRRLHEAGWVHSVEVWRQEQMVGGIYGVAIGGAFFGESMVSLETNGSKVALFALSVVLQKDGFDLIDCQMHTAHLQSLGATLWSRTRFSKQLAESCRDLKPWQPPPSIDRGLLLA